MNNSFFNTNEYYLVDRFNGEIKKNRINLRIVDNSKYLLNSYKQVIIETKIKKINKATGEVYHSLNNYEGFVRSSKDKVRDELDIINSEIASLIGVSSSHVFHLENYNNDRGIINIGVKELDQKLITLDVLVNNLINTIKTQNIDAPDWLKKYFSININDENNLLEDEELIISVIEMTINIIGLFFKLNQEELEKSRKRYIRMILFDLISNNTNRSFNTYSVTLSNQNIFIELTPIYDYNNETDIKNYYILNNKYINKTAIFSTIYHKYYPYIKSLSKSITDNINLYKDSISLIINNNIDGFSSETVNNYYNANLDLIKSLELLHQKNSHENKLDLAMTQTSINLGVINRNQLVQSKYANSKKKNKEEREDVTIRVEEKIRNPFYLKLLLFIVGILILIALASIIAYYILYVYE